MTQSPCRCLDWQTTLILRMVPSDEEDEKEAKRQRSEPTTPISTSSRLPYEYDEAMGITQVDPREAEGFDEGLDLDYHDASENPSVPESSDSRPKSVLSHGGCGSSSLHECIELLNNTERNPPPTLHSGVKKEKTSDPQQKLYKNWHFSKPQNPNLDQKMNACFWENVAKFLNFCFVS